MKKCFGCLTLCLVLILCLFVGCSSEEEGKRPEVLQPNAQLYVNDDAGILSGETEEYIVSRVNALKALCGGEIAVATIDFLPMALNSEEYAFELINQWGVGDKEKNNGVVLLLVPGEAKGWITAGSGIEGSLTAGKLDQILNTWLWRDFDNGKYDVAVKNTVDAVIEWYESYYGISVGTSSGQLSGSFGGGMAEAPEYDGESYSLFDIIKFIVVVIAIVYIFSSIFGGTGTGGGRNRTVIMPMFFGGSRRGPRPPMGGGFSSGPTRRPPGGFGGGSRGRGFGGGRSGGFGGGGGRGGGAGRR